jgi:uncharacterized protein
MLINVINLAPNDKQEVAFNNVELSLPNDVTANVCLDGVITNDSGGMFTLDGKVSAVLSLNCDLCLKPFKSDIKFDINEVFFDTSFGDGVFSNDNNSEKELWDFSDKTINLKPAVVADILLNMPMRAVCSDDCKGLCPKCGHNLNDGDCGCDRGYRNPQFEKLMTLFNDKEV